MRNLAHLASRMYNVGLVIEPGKAAAIESVFRSALDTRFAPQETVAPPMELAAAGTTFTRTRPGYLRSESGIALIQVLGPLVQRGAGIDAVSGGFESYENLGRQLSAARADPEVRTILLEFDSPGGEANGVQDLARQVRAIAGEKRVVAHANEAAFSAAYWLASAASELYVPTTGMVGSIGVILLHVDQSQFNAKRGLEVTHIMAGARKADFSPHQPLSDEALGRAQSMVDRLYGQFVDAVASFRGVSVRAVQSTEAALLNADEALAQNLIDGVRSFESVVHMLASGSATTRPSTTARAAAAAPNPTVSRPSSIETEQDDMYTNQQLRSRIRAILSSYASMGRERLALKLVDSDGTSIEAAIAILRSSAKEQSSGPPIETSAEMYARMQAQRETIIKTGSHASHALDSDDPYARMQAQREAIITQR